MDGVLHKTLERNCERIIAYILLQQVEMGAKLIQLRLTDNVLNGWKLAGCGPLLIGSKIHLHQEAVDVE